MLERRYDFELSAYPEDASALVFDGDSLTYGELLAEVESLVSQLHAEGMGPGRLVAIEPVQARATIIFLLANGLVGGTTLIINSRWTQSEKAQLLASLQLPATQPLPEPGSDWQVDSSNFVAAHRLSGVQWLLATSGTTSQPKLVALSYEAVLAATRMTASVARITEKDVWLSSLPLFHVGGLMAIFRSLFVGAKAVHLSRYDWSAMCDGMTTYRATHLSIVPTMLIDAMATVEGAAVLRDRKMILVGGAAVDRSVLQWAQSERIPLAPSYGMTEACSQICTMSPEHFLQADLSEPLRLDPLPGVKVTSNEADELSVVTPALATGYFDPKAAMIRSITDGSGAFCTGDVGDVHPDGAISVASRRNDLIICGGENISPTEIEAVLRTHPDVTDAAVIGMDEPRLGQVPVAFVACNDDLSAQSLLEHCAKGIASYKVPREIVFIQELPRTAIGKIDQRALRRWLASGSQDDAA